jgi:hypothetical protein
MREQMLMEINILNQKIQEQQQKLNELSEQQQRPPAPEDPATPSQKLQFFLQDNIVQHGGKFCGSKCTLHFPLKLCAVEELSHTEALQISELKSQTCVIRRMLPYVLSWDLYYNHVFETLPDHIKSTLIDAVVIKFGRNFDIKECRKAASDHMGQMRRAKWKEDQVPDEQQRAYDKTRLNNQIQLRKKRK